MKPVTFNCCEIGSLYETNIVKATSGDINLKKCVSPTQKFRNEIYLLGYSGIVALFFGP
jgi:hypothetical protein